MNDHWSIVQREFTKRGHIRFWKLFLILLAASQIFVTLKMGALSLEKSQECRAKLSYSQGTFRSGKYTVAIERYEPRSKGRYPAILFVHGSGGLISRAPGSELPKRDNFGEIPLACAGYVVAVVHYFDTVGVRSTADIDFMKSHQELWLKTLSDSLTYLAGLHGVDQKRFGVMGESLGGYLALSLAARDSRVRAVSEHYGGNPGLTAAEFRMLPPVLIQHGSADTIVPVREAYLLQSNFESNNTPCAIHIYPGLEHNLNTAGRAAALELSRLFFDRYLKTHNKQNRVSTGKCESLALPPS
jgi:dienelactone hydrolase